jgi:phage baseplate assembly protein W
MVDSVSPLGYGLICPFRFTSAQDFASADGRELVRSDLLSLIGVEQGEVPWNPRLGVRLERLRHRAGSRALSALVRVEVDRAISSNDPRVRVKSVTAVGSPAGSKLELHVSYETAGQKDSATTTI